MCQDNKGQGVPWVAVHQKICSIGYNVGTQWATCEYTTSRFWATTLGYGETT
jgi:hypothetical protein